ncbi:MAG: Nuclear control of ATPase protein 2 [Pycnora praestabilis]|nr:MAG: Nuclear control of ATPase protein 2 [Pycnora praestabilis]
MSFVADQVRRLDGQLDRLQLSGFTSAPSLPILRSSSEVLDDASNEAPKLSTSPQILQLQAIVKSLSTASSSQPILRAAKIQSLLEQADLAVSTVEVGAQNQVDASYKRELEWLLVSKATAQTYGVILNVLLEQTIPLTNDIWYWDEVLGSYRYTGLYSIQTSPLRFWQLSKDIYQDAKSRLESMTSSTEANTQTNTSLADRWRQFYGLVKDSIRDRSLADVQRQVMSPFALCRAEARQKQNSLRKFREMGASGLGVLMDEGLNFDIDEEGGIATKGHDDDHHEWKTVVAKSVALMETVLRNVTTLEVGVAEFEDTVFASVEDDAEIVEQPADDGLSTKPALLSARLQHILQTHIPSHITASQRLAKDYGRPSRFVRYWLPATVIFLSSSTLLRILVNRKAEILTWIEELGTTTVDFWSNWVVEPAKKVIGTIRHDKDSEVAIMSKDSLKGDKASLERMVVDFAIDNPDNTSGGPLTETEIADVRAKVKEGDLTPVLKAYERDLRKPFMGTIRGELVRALLIQVQKTKVDVEVAMGGIDALLKSQELVFGFVGLTPGVLVCVAISRWLSGFLGGRKGIKQSKKQGQMVRILRNVDRILTTSTPANNGMLSYKDHGLLLCEIHMLRQSAQRVLPGEVNREFLEDVDDLVDIRTGIERQLKVVGRIRWAYEKWLR